MNFMGIGPLELLSILFIIILLIKPDDIGKMARSAGRTLNRLLRSDEWRMVNRAARDIRDLPNRVMREAQLEEIQALKKDLDQTSQKMKRAGKNLRSELSTEFPVDLPSISAISSTDNSDTQKTGDTPGDAEGLSHENRSGDHADEEPPND